jgi:exodeoxyribonuclease VII large subunit
VADVRASTPTDAAKRVVPDVREELDRVHALRARGSAALAARLDREQQHLDGVRSRPALADPLRLLEERRQAAEDLRQRARRCVAQRIARAEDDLSHVRARVRALSPANTLARGYAVVQRADGVVVRSPADVTAGDALRLRVAGGELAATAGEPALARARPA